MQVFELLMNWTVYGSAKPADSFWEEERRLAREERMRRELIAGLTNMTFNEVPVSLCADVPDGRLWPSRLPGSQTFQETSHACA